MYFLKTEQSFDSAHFLKDYNGKCRNIHGHRWTVVIEVKGEALNHSGAKRGMIIDFGDLKDELKNLCDELDHCLICEKDSLKQKTFEALIEEDFKIVQVPFVPTAENFSKYFFDKMKSMNYPINRVEVYETPNNVAIYEEEK